MADDEANADDATGQGGPPAAEAIRIVPADDHAVVSSGLRLLLDNEPGFEVVAETVRAAEHPFHAWVSTSDRCRDGVHGLSLAERVTRAFGTYPGTACGFLRRHGRSARHTVAHENDSRCATAP
jgi:hypothetical protein